MIAVRKARTEDRDDVLGFTRNTFGWGDYLGDVFDDWLHDSTGALLVAETDQKAVGIVHLAKAAAMQGWLEGLRIDPEYRGIGLGENLSEAALRVADQIGFKTVRMVIEAKNAASRALAEKLGFGSVMTFKTLSATALKPKHIPGIRRALASDVSEALSLLRASSSKGHCFSGWQCAYLDEAALGQNIEDGALLVYDPGHGRSIEACGWLVLDSEGPMLSMCCGKAEGMRRLFEATRRHQSNHTGFAYSINVVASAEERLAMLAGFAEPLETGEIGPANLEMLYEKLLRP